ncbi:MAG: hypothetical protein FWC20_07925 [Oscillospiraceae bacterium]|nr:hypothetical protein [Oscillospiraceae bacterium]MCL2279315.1 hypothetical protein [Oscillospiraceae bacterium]
MDENRNAKTKRKLRIFAVIAACVILVAVLSLFLRHSHLQRLRSEMETHLLQSITYVESGQNDLAHLEAVEARGLAIRLGDNDYEHITLQQIALIRSLNLGQELFDEHRFSDAHDAYTSALGFSHAIIGINTHFIVELLEITDGHIYFEEMIHYAWSLAEQDDFENALKVYENALTLASSLSFGAGIKLAEDSIEDTRQRIIEAKRVIAGEYESQGDYLYEIGLFEQAIVIFQNALEIYTEIDDQDAVIEINTKIEAAEQSHAAYLAEIQRLEEERLEALRLEAERLEALRLEESRREDERQDEQHHIIVDVNYQHNRSIYFDLETPIDNQNTSPANLIKMGSRPGQNEGWYNGCGWVAAYNALIILGEPVHPAVIVNHFKANEGTVLDGVLGTFPNAIERFLIDSGYDVTHTLFPGRTLNLDEAIRASRVSVLAYAHTRTAHFITIVYNPYENFFVVYNCSFARRRSRALGLENATETGAAVDSITALLRETSEILFSFSLIAVE